MAIDEIETLADHCNVSRGRVIIWDKEGRKVCAVAVNPSYLRLITSQHMLIFS
jgi:hypothetical protein